MNIIIKKRYKIRNKKKIFNKFTKVKYLEKKKKYLN